MRILVSLIAVVLLLCGCISWTGDQKEVVDSYRLIAQHMEDGNWNGLRNCLTSDSRDLLSTVTDVYTDAGAPFDNSVEKLLMAMASDTDILIFPQTILSVEFSGERAILVAEDQGGSHMYEFYKESGRWRLDLVPVLDELFETIMRGVSGNPFAAGSENVLSSYISSGYGPCRLTVRNSLPGIALHNAFCSLSTSDSWGDDLLGPSILGTAAELGINLEPGVYDIQVYDSMERSYTLWEVNVTEAGVLWEVTEADLD